MYINNLINKQETQIGASQVVQLVENLPANAEDTLEEEMATHSSMLAWEIPQTEEPSRLLSMVLQKVRHN